jgi:HEPN domain-containing protein
MRNNNWLTFAKDDLKAAHILMRERICNLACFHAQQAAEKILKAYLSAKRGKVPSKILDQFYVPTRYPDAMVGSLPNGLPTEKHAQEAIRMAEEIFHFVKGKL